MTRKAVLLAAFAFLLPALAMAGSVTFTTSGTFSNPTLFPISFQGINPSVTTQGGFVSFGTFTLKSCKACSGSETFTLTIDQTAPTFGQNDLDLKLAGSVTKSKGSQLVLHFSQVSVTIGSITYSLTGPFLTINGATSKGPGITSLQGNVSTAEPNARLLLGLGTLGLVGLTLVSRKMITA